MSASDMRISNVNQYYEEQRRFGKYMYIFKKVLDLRTCGNIEVSDLQTSIVVMKY